MRWIYILLNSFLLLSSYAFAQTEVSTVTFYPDRVLHLDPQDYPFHKAVNQYIIKSIKSQGLNISTAPLKHKSNYYITLNYGLGCPNMGESVACNIMILWNIYRGDHAPVTSWEAFYKVPIAISKQKKRFIGYQVPPKMIAKISDDFLKSLIYETLKNQEHDYIYIMPDRLEDQTTLCSADALKNYYTQAGFQTTDKAYYARFLIKSDIKIKNDENNNNMKTLFIRRLILDRMTGLYKILPIQTVIEDDFLSNDSYDCQQSAMITMQDVGLFINQAP